jgi:hypothetical protein
MRTCKKCGWEEDGVTWEGRRLGHWDHSDICDAGKAFYEECRAADVKEASDKIPTVQNYTDAILERDSERARALFDTLTDEAEQTGDEDAVQMRIAMYATEAAAALEYLRESAKSRQVSREDLRRAMKMLRKLNKRLHLLQKALPKDTRHTSDDFLKTTFGEARDE